MNKMKTDQYTEEIVYQWQKTWSEKDLVQSIENCGKDTVLLPYFIQYLPRNGKILESGCGFGHWVVYLKRLGYQMAGLEIVPDCVETCKKFFPETEMKVGDVRKIPYPDNSFAGYISIGVFEHMIEGPETTILEMYRVLKSGGISIIIVPAFNYFMRLWYPIRQLFVKLLRRNEFVRKILGKQSYPSSKNHEFKLKTKEIEEKLQSQFWPVIGFDPVKGPMFIEYKCKRGHLDGLLKSKGFEIVESVPISHPHIFHDIFGNIFLKKGGEFPKGETLQLNFCGRFIQAFSNALSPHFFNYVYIYIVRANK